MLPPPAEPSGSPPEVRRKLGRFWSAASRLRWDEANDVESLAKLFDEVDADKISRVAR